MASSPIEPSNPALSCQDHYTAFLGGLQDMAAGTPSLCVVLDLGDLRRADRVARTLGPGYVDGLIAAAAQRIRQALPPGTALIEIDTGCFAFSLADNGETNGSALVQGIVESLQQPLDCAGLPGVVAPSAGIVRYRTGEIEPRDVVLGAITAAQDARDTDAAWHLHDTANADRTWRRLSELLAGLEPALAAPDQLSLVYQPRIDLRTGDCRSAEALLRWNHPGPGNVPPGEFIPIAEQTGMARFITAWVLDRALSDLAAWTSAGFRHGVSVNISAVNLAEENFAGRLRQALDRHGIDPAQVELEFTEGALVRNSPRVRGTVADLAAIGVGISIDDFGTGYSNLFYLRDIPASALKIDQSFIRGLTTNDRDPIIVRSMIDLAHALGYRVVAEGIEDAGALALLTSWGCDEGQGYHISRPVPLPALQAWLLGRSDTGGTG